MIPRASWDRVRALPLMAVLAAPAAGCASATRVPAVTTVPKYVASEGLGTAETSNRRLRDSLSRLAGAPTAAAHREVAAAYRALGITDRAFDHLKLALLLDPADAAAHDHLARMWRDWGLPQLGLADAHAAVKQAPQSAVAHNTLGTLLEVMGRFQEARRAYEHALALDAGANYASTNLTRMTALEDAAAQSRREPLPAVVKP